MIAPTENQIHILRMLNAPGAEIRTPKKATSSYPLYIGGRLVTVVRRKTMAGLVDAGWLQYDEPKTRWVIGHSGRAHAEVGAFVRAFAESA